MKPFTIILVNWNGSSYLKKFLGGVLEHSAHLAEIILFDNASTDDSREYVQNNFPTVTIISHHENSGFATGNNLAFSNVRTEYSILLNTDVEVTAGWIEPIWEILKNNPQIAAVQPKIRSYHQKENFEYAGAAGGFLDFLTYPICRGRIFDHLERDENQYDDTIQIFWATGACVAVNVGIVKRIGLFDDKFFAHWEEIDFCWRAQNFGYEIWVEPKSVVYHVGGGTLSKDSPRKTFLNFRNSLITLLKNLPISEAIFLILCRLILDGIAGMKGLLNGEFQYFYQILRAHFSFYSYIPYALKQRQHITHKSFNKLHGVVRRSAVWYYFIKKIQTFQGLISK